MLQHVLDAAAACGCTKKVVIIGHEAELVYRLQQGRLTIDHTGVPAAIGGKGVAGELVKAALEYARAEGLRVVAACSYSAAYVQRHPEYADLLA